MMVLKVILYFVTLFIININAGPIVRRSHLGSTSLIRSPQKIPVKKESGLNSNNLSLEPVPVTYSSDDANDDAYRVDMDPVLYHRSFYLVGGEGQRSKSTTLKYGVTNIGSRQHRYGEGTWRPNSDQTEQEKSHNLDNNSSNNSNINNNNNNSNNSNNSNNKPVPRRKEKSLTGVDTQGHVLDPVSPTQENENENDDDRRRKEQQKDIVAVDNHGQLHTLALPITILPGN